MITALLIIAVGAVLRGIWSLQQRVSHLEGLDEKYERSYDTGRKRPKPYDQEEP